MVKKINKHVGQAFPGGVHLVESEKDLLVIG